MNKTITATAIAKMRRSAKQQSRETGVAYGQALESAARAAGFASWHHVVQASQPRTGSRSNADFPVDPVLPADFYETPNEDRSPQQLDEWWMRPYAVTRPDGTLDVRCLDGGAWDRPTFYGVASSLDEARELARIKLAQWQEYRDTPRVMLAGGRFQVILEPNRPGLPWPVLFEAADAQAAVEFIAGWSGQRVRTVPEDMREAIRAISRKLR